MKRRDGAYIFKSLRHDYIKQILNIGEAQIANENFKIPIAEDLSPNDDTRELIENIEDFVSMGSDVKIRLNRLKTEKILTLYRLKVSADFLSYAFPLASSKRNTKSVHQVMETIRQWDD